MGSINYHYDIRVIMPVDISLWQAVKLRLIGHRKLAALITDSVKAAFVQESEIIIARLQKAQAELRRQIH